MVVAGTAVIGSSANATEYLVTVTGKLNGETDPLGLFGPPDISGILLGDAVAVTYLYDPTLGIPGGDSVNETYTQGGTNDATSSPILSETITVNGHSATLDPAYYGEVYAMRQVPSALEPDFESSGELVAADSLLAGGQQKDRLKPFVKRHMAGSADMFKLVGNRPSM